MGSCRFSSGLPGEIAEALWRRLSVGRRRGAVAVVTNDATQRVSGWAMMSEPVQRQRLWIVPQNDAESFEIVDLLREAGEPVLITKQKWGARWKGLEPETVNAIRRFAATHEGADIVGVELAGLNSLGARNVDHHLYDDEDRRCPLSSIEQIANELGVTLSRRRRLIALNDRGYVRAMRREGATEEEIREIRTFDRRCQGLTAEHDRQADEDISRAEWRGRKVFVRCQGPANSAHADALFAGDLCDEALIASVASWNYSGPRHLEFMGLDLPERHWAGGEQDSGYFGVSHPGTVSQLTLLELFWRPE